jgi:glycosyltransferase involved in cell wall biosynthesis
MSEPLVSVHMITYNHAPYIAKAIECVLAQKTSFPFELVIGEDCSTDGTREIVLDYAGRFPEKIRVITSDRNVGMQENSNRVNAALRGKYIAWCEGDDYWHSEGKLQLQVDYLESHPDCGLTCSDYDQYDVKNNKTTRCNFRNSWRNVVESPDIQDILSGNGGILTCTVMARKELIDRIRVSDPFLHQSGHFKMGDTQLWAEASIFSRVYRFSDSFATRNLLPESATQSKDRNKVLRFWVSYFELCVYLSNKHKLPKEFGADQLRVLRRKTLRLAYIEGNRELAESVKKKYPGFSIKDFVWYYATRFMAVRYFFSRLLEMRK